MRDRRKEHPARFAKLKVIRKHRRQVPDAISQEFTAKKSGDDQERDQRKEYELVERQAFSKPNVGRCVQCDPPLSRRKNLDAQRVGRPI